MDPDFKNEDQQAERFVTIPEIFHSDLTGKPIESCVMCEKNLIDGHEPYLVEKAFRYYQEYDIHNTIFEYAMCMPCAQKMHQSMSKESRQKIQAYFEQINMAERSKSMWEEKGNDLNEWIANCIVKDAPRKNLEEYQVCAQCIGDKLVFDALPYMLSMAASEEITALLSAQTLDEYNRFVDDYFGLPPAFKKALKDSPVLV